MDLAQKAEAHTVASDIPAIQVRNLRRSYGNRFAVDNLDLNVTQGSVTQTIALPQVDEIHMEGDSIFATGTDGRVVRLDPVG